MLDGADWDVFPARDARWNDQDIDWAWRRGADGAQMIIDVHRWHSVGHLAKFRVVGIKLLLFPDHVLTMLHTDL